MVITKVEMEDGENHVFCFNREALGKDNIKLAIIDEDDSLGFIQEDDIIFSRTFSRQVIERIKSIGVKNTAESWTLYNLVRDKVSLSSFLENNGIIVPKRYFSNDIKEGCVYFVKPRYGYDSFGITSNCICKSKQDVVNQILRIEEGLNQDTIVEGFIEGEECTVACLNLDKIHTYAMEIDCSQTGGIQVHDCKVGFGTFCTPLHDVGLENVAKKVFTLLGIKHHARIDFRRGRDGKYYLIDINLLPGLGPISYFARCMLLSSNISYIDTLLSLVNTASKG